MAARLDRQNLLTTGIVNAQLRPAFVIKAAVNTGVVVGSIMLDEELSGGDLSSWAPPSVTDYEDILVL